MVRLTVFPECQNNRHVECRGSHSAGFGVFGGARCTCSCHDVSQGNPISSIFPKDEKKGGKPVCLSVEKMRPFRDLLSAVRTNQLGDEFTKDEEKKYRKNLKKQGPIIQKGIRALQGRQK